MAVNKPVGDNARRGAVEKPSQGPASLDQARQSPGEFRAVKKSAKKFNDVRK
jgi:hypothetical protein